MKLFGNPSVLRGPNDDDDGGGDGTPLNPALRAEVNRAMNGFFKRELPKMLQQQVAAVFQEQMPKLTEQFMGSLAEQIPDEEEIDDAEMQEAMAAGYNPQDDTFYTPDGLPYDPTNGAVFHPQTGEQIAQIGEDGQIYEIEEEGGGPEMDMQDPRTNAALMELRNANRALQQQLDEIQRDKEETMQAYMQANLESTISKAMEGHSFPNERAALQFRKFVEANVFQLDDGSFAAGDQKNPLPINSFVEQELQASPHLAAARPMGGSGAFQGVGAKKGVPTMESIKVGQDPKERQQIVAYAVDKLKETMGGASPTI